MASSLININQMIDLALGTPDIGAVNFNVLHALLSVIVQQMGLERCRIEFSGNQSNKIENLIRNIPESRVLSIAEYEIDKNVKTGEGEMGKRILLEKPSQADEIEKVLVIRKTDETDIIGSENSTSKHKPPPPGFPQQPIRVVSQDDFKKLTPRVEKIQDGVAATIPENQELFDSARNPIGEMFNLLNLTKRVDATEIAIGKLTSMLRDLSEEYKTVGITIERLSSRNDISDLMDKIDVLEKAVYDTHTEQNIRSETTNPDIEHQRVVDSSSRHDNRSTLQDDANNRYRNNLIIDHTKKDQEIEAMRTEIYQIKNMIQQISMNVSAPPVLNNFPNKSFEEIVTEPSESQVDIQNPQGGFGREHVELIEAKLATMEHQIYDIQKTLTELDEKVEGAQENQMPGGVDFFSQVETIKIDLTDTQDKSNFLMSEHDHMAKVVDNLIKQITELKNSKIDKDEIEDLLSDKVDYSMLQRKVSMEQFDTTKQDFMSELYDTIRKFEELETNWQEMIQDIQTRIDLKLDKMEISELKEYFDKKTRAIQDRLKALAALRREPEAAGTRKKFLQDVNCISCDQDVIMKINELDRMPKAGFLIPQRSIKPFLTYQLDNIRKQMNGGIGRSRNLHHFETLIKDKEPLTGRTRPLSARYCGGSHTIITPHDRVARVAPKPYEPANIQCGTKDNQKTPAMNECNCPSIASGPAEQPQDL